MGIDLREGLCVILNRRSHMAHLVCSSCPWIPCRPGSHAKHTAEVRDSESKATTGIIEALPQGPGQPRP